MGVRAGYLVRSMCALTTAAFIWSQAGQVQAAESKTLVDKLPAGIKTIIDNAKDIAGVYSGFSGTIDAALLIAQLLGIANKFDQAEEFRKLHEHLDQLGAALDWKLHVDNQDKRLAKVLATVHTIGPAVDLRMPFNLATDGVSGSLEAVYEAGSKDQFLRYYRPSATDGMWKDLIPARPKVNSSNYVYDWRLGVPGLMQLISLRLIIVAAIDPNFPKDMVFKTQLLKHRSDLLAQYNNMIEGVRCGGRSEMEDTLAVIHGEDTGLTVSIACADIHTGHTAMDTVETTYWSYIAAKEEFDSRFVKIREGLYTQVLLKMPLFQMRSMIDMLYLYANGGPDLTKAKEFIQVAAAPNLCLEVQRGNPTPGTPVQVWDCDGGGFAQHWVYDRQAGTIRNPVYDKCLDVQWGNPTPGTPAQIWDCNGGLAQKWTYDPETQVLQNALGTVLDIQWGALQATTPVWTWGRNEGPAQRWTSPPFDPAVLEDGLLDQVDRPIQKGEGRIP